MTFGCRCGAKGNLSELGNGWREDHRVGVFFSGQAASGVTPRPVLRSREGFDRYCLEGWVSSRNVRVSKKMVSE